MRVRRSTHGVMAMILVSVLLTWAMPTSAQHQGHGDDDTGVTWSCDTLATPAAEAHGQHGMDESSTPDPAQAEIDLLYIDMMIPHHASIIALSEAALPLLSDPRLIEIAEKIITAQTAENEQMAAWREAWYGSPNPDMSEGAMMLMLEAMPVGTMDQMMREMDANWQVSTFCAAADPDTAFIRQAIRHHQMAIDASVAVADRLVHEELVEFANGVIAVQQGEIEELTAILEEIEAATPAA